MSSCVSPTLRPLVAFCARLCVSIAVTFALLGAAGYVLIGDQLERRLIEGYDSEQMAAVATMASAAQRADAHEGEDPLSEVREVLGTFARQPAVNEVLLVDERGIIVGAGDERRVGTQAHDPHVSAALHHARTFVGRADGGRGDIVTVSPIDVPVGDRAGGNLRLAVAVRRDAAVLDDQLSDVRGTTVLLALLAMVGGMGVFWLVGGRRLIRSHRIALQRADRDGLTDLPNHRAFREALAREIGATERHRDELALLMLDIDDFRYLNDRHGHAHGDALLRRVSAVLQHVRAGDRAYRVGGDEFALLLPRTDAQGARAAALRLSRLLADADIAASIGIGAHSEGHEADTLFAETAAALTDAARRGGRAIVHFEDVEGEVAVTTPEEERAVRRMLDEGAITTAFQPIWDLGTRTLLGVEALTRPAEGHGLQGPAHAFDVAEQIGRVHELDALCVRSALRAARELPPEALLFVNLSPQTLDRDGDGDGDDWLLEAVREAGVAPERVVLEVTERFGARTIAVVRSLHRLRAHGFRLALDDVGTGNSGLEMLHAVGADFVKLDRSIVTGSPTERNARGVLLAMATFARQTGAFVIAEGIEDVELLEYLRTIDDRLTREGATIIQGGQGYALGRPSAELPAAGARLDELPRVAA